MLCELSPHAIAARIIMTTITMMATMIRFISQRSQMASGHRQRHNPKRLNSGRSLLTLALSRHSISSY